MKVIEAKNKDMKSLEIIATLEKEIEALDFTYIMGRPLQFSMETPSILVEFDTYENGAKLMDIRLTMIEDDPDETIVWATEMHDSLIEDLLRRANLEHFTEKFLA